MAGQDKRKLNADNRLFTFAAQPTFSLDDSGAKSKRKFAGVAYSGEVIPQHPYWGNVIFDLTSMSITTAGVVNTKLPAWGAAGATE